MSDRFDASIKRGHQVTLSNVMGRLQAGSQFTLTPQEFTDLSDLAGALNYWAAQAVSLPKILHDDIPAGDYTRRLFSQAVGVVDVFPFRVPGPPYGASGSTFYMSASENPSIPGAAPWLRRLTVSTKPGDMDAALSSDSKQPTVYLQAGVDFPVGTILYANLLLLEDATPDTTGSGFSIVWP
jgi:hypothetical protein